MMNLMTGTTHKYYSGDQVENNEMGGACSTIGREEVYIGIWCGKSKEREHLENPGLDGRTILY